MKQHSFRSMCSRRAVYYFAVKTQSEHRWLMSWLPLACWGCGSLLEKEGQPKHPNTSRLLPPSESLRYVSAWRVNEPAPEAMWPLRGEVNTLTQMQTPTGQEARLGLRGADDRAESWDGPQLHLVKVRSTGPSNISFSLFLLYHSLLWPWDLSWPNLFSSFCSCQGEI